jgi:hypothetical protein
MNGEALAVAEAIPAPTRCFCQIPVSELIVWARRKFLDHLSTIQLLAMASDQREREAVGIVALLDIPDADVILLLTPVTPSHCNILACRDRLREWLQAMLAWPDTREESYGR